MVVAAFVAPFLLPATARFVATAAQLPGVRLAVITTTPADRVPPELAQHLAGHWRVDDALDPRQIAAGGGRAVPPARAGAAAGRGPGAAAGAAGPGPGDAGPARHGRRDRAQRARQVPDEDGAVRGRRAVRPAPAGHRPGRRRWPSPAEVGLPAGGQAAGRGRGAGHLPARRRRRAAQLARRAAAARRTRPGCWRSSWSARSTRSTASPSAGRPSGRPSRTTCRRRSRCCATRGSSGRCCCPGSCPTRGTRRSRRSGRPRCGALGVRDALSHMEWFRRPDGSVAVSEVGARPPGAQISSMLGYVHDVDFYRVWTELVILDRFDPPERKFAAGTAYLRGQGRGRVRAVHGVEELQRRIGHLVVEARLPEPGQPASSSYEGEGYVIVRHPDTAGGAGRAAADRRRHPGRAGGGAVDDHGGDALPRLPGRDGLLHPGAGRRPARG